MTSRALVLTVLATQALAACGDTDSDPARTVSPTPPAVATVPDELAEPALRALSMDDLLARLDTTSAYARILATRELKRRVRERTPDPDWLPQVIELSSAWRCEPTGLSQFRPDEVFAPFGPAAVPALGDVLRDPGRGDEHHDVARRVLRRLVRRSETAGAVVGLARDLARSPETRDVGLDLWTARPSRRPAT